jgi:polar amino acid transport system substrate-binding protein
VGMAAVATLWASAAMANRLDDIKARGTLICGTQNASSPYAFQDPKTREYVGYDVDMCQAVAKQMGLKLEHKPMSTAARIPEVTMGRVDVVAGSVAWLPKRAEQVDFSLQYLQGDIKVLVRQDSGIKSLAELAGKKVCASSGSSSAAIAQKVLKGANVLTFENISQCYLGLESGKVAAMTAGELVLLRFAINSQKSGKPVVLLPEPTYTEHIGMVVKKGEPELLKAIDYAILALDKSGQLTKIYVKWLGEGSIYKLKRTFKVEPVDVAAKNEVQ